MTNTNKQIIQNVWDELDSIKINPITSIQRKVTIQIETIVNKAIKRLVNPTTEELEEMLDVLNIQLTRGVSRRCDEMSIISHNRITNYLSELK